MIKFADIEYVIRPLLEVGMFYPKSGEDHEVVVSSFYIKERSVIKDLISFINYMPISSLIDATPSNFVDEKGYYTIFIELSIGEKTFEDIMRIMYELMSISNKEEWSIKMYKNKERTYSYESVKKYFM